VATIESWVTRLRALAPVTGVAQELVKFDTQAIQNPEVSGVEYQRGELHGYEVREYLLEKWGRKCTYCGAEGCPLEVEHIVPKARGGSNRVSNLTLACHACNQRKGAKSVEEFLAKRPQILKRIKAVAQAPLKDAAAVNATRWALFETLKSTGLAVRTGTGGMTKWNRNRFGVPKEHALDAMCVGEMSTKPHGWKETATLSIECRGRGTHQVSQFDKYGFPRRKKDGTLQSSKATKCPNGVATGDLVRTATGACGYISRARADGTSTVVTHTGDVNLGKAATAAARVLQYSNGYRVTLHRTGTQCAQTRCGTTVVAPDSTVPESAPEPSSRWDGSL
jgi:5-methylcytosine-specific restriction endonuclease McrA